VFTEPAGSSSSRLRIHRALKLIDKLEHAVVLGLELIVLTPYSGQRRLNLFLVGTKHVDYELLVVYKRFLLFELDLIALRLFRIPCDSLVLCLQRLELGAQFLVVLGLEMGELFIVGSVKLFEVLLLRGGQDLDVCLQLLDFLSLIARRSSNCVPRRSISWVCFSDKAFVVLSMSASILFLTFSLPSSS